MTDDRHAEVRELLASYVLSAIPSDEVAAVRHHVLTCEECMSEADGYGPTLDRLALTVEPIEPPLGFSDRVLSAVREEPEAGLAPVVRPARWFRSPAMLASAAMLLVTAVLAAGLIGTRRELAREKEVTAALLSARVGEDLEGVGGVAKVLPAGAGSLFVATRLAPPPNGRAYQLWFIGEEGPVSAGLLDVRDGPVVVNLALAIEEFDVVAVTIEPAGGSELPTTDPILISH